MWTKIRHPFETAILASALLATSIVLSAHAATTPRAVKSSSDAGSTTSIAHWKIQSSAKAPQDGKEISEPGFSTKDWYPVSGHATLMAGLLENGKYPNVFYSNNLEKVQVPDTDHHRFQIPWWYRTTFQIPSTGANLHTFLKTNGITASADLWLNGRKIADHGDIAGALTTHEIDITADVHAGSNVLAIRVHPGSAERDLLQGWVDWNPEPPDNNMGIWRDVNILRTGPVSLHDLHVTSKLALPGLDHADLTVKAEVRNETATVQNVVVNGHIAGIDLHRSVQLAPHASRTLTFDPSNQAGLSLDHPKVWWPAGMGAQPLYQLTMTADVAGAISDRAQTSFGIRDVSSHLTAQGYRQFAINGQPLLIRGAGWAPDMFLRDQPGRLADEFSYVRNLGLNTIRTEGKLERQDFYDLADRDGIMILAGWECCDKWEAWAGTGGEPWSAADLHIVGASMASEARRLRNHPSVIGFLIGSDNAPPPKIAETYVSALRAADWPDPIISAASAQKTAIAGPSGMKMSGPYAWVPPNYWYADKVGGAFGFNAETSAGVDIPRLDTLRDMLAPRDLEALWHDPDMDQLHAAPLWSPFTSLKAFDTALAQRYGAPKNLDDYVEKAQLANYEAVRAQFEAYAARMDAAQPATGVIYWMLNGAWPSLHWHLFNHDLSQAGAYFGAQQANEPIHIQYGYDDRTIMGINYTLQSMGDLDARIRVYNLDGSVRYKHTLNHIVLPANHATRLAVIPALTKLSDTYFVELELTAADGHEVSRNVYWLSSQQDQLRWADSNWYTTPVNHYADLTALQQLPTATVTASVQNQREGNQGTTTVTLKAMPASKAVALFMHLSMRQAANGKPLLPVTWSSNDTTLWPGESVTLTAHYRVTSDIAPAVQLSGWNVSSRTLSTSTH